MSNYERYYQIGFLDDLHNYFPDILYNINRFNNVQDVLTYIQSETRNRFDLFSNARRRHVTSMETDDDNQEAPLPPLPPQHRNVSDNIRVTFNIDDDIGGTPNSTEDQNTLAAIANILQIFSTAATLPQTTRFDNMWNVNTFDNRANRFNFMEPVVVRPTANEIQRSSTIIELSNSTDNCAICQEGLVNSSQCVRRINHCQHMFHDDCILRWFERNVRCPTCRYDIRS